MRALLYDTETTGLIANRTIKIERQPEVIEFYGCLADLATGEIEEELELLIRPTRSEITAKITQITGIDYPMVEDKPPFREVADQIARMIEAAPVIIGHNIAFDVEIVDIEFERIGRTLTWPPVLCTVEQTVHVLGHFQNLSSLHEHLLGRKLEGAHRAKNDVLGLLAVACELFKRGML
jgi:DNA polymerase-3 subunit alpha